MLKVKCKNINFPYTIDKKTTINDATQPPTVKMSSHKKTTVSKKKKKFALLPRPER